MSNQEWRVLDGEGNEMGPYSLQDLQNYFASGNITRETLVWTEGFAEWYPAGQVQGLLPESPPAAAPPAPPTYQASPAPPAAPPRTGAPLWLSLTTLGISLICLILYFFPWVSLSLNTNPEGKPKMMTAFTQTGMQSVTTDITVTDDFLSAYAGILASLSGIDKAEIKEDLKKEMNEDPEWKSSTLNLVAFIVIGLAVILVLIGILNKLASLVIIAQSLLAVGAVLIGIQMAIQFPVIENFVEEQKAEREKLAEEQAAEAKRAKEAEDSPTTPETARQKEKGKKSQPKNTKLYKTSFLPSCYTTVGLLALSLFLVVITMSSSNNTPLITPQANYQSPQPGTTPQQSNQPGGGLRFH